MEDRKVSIKDLVKAKTTTDDDAREASQQALDEYIRIRVMTDDSNQEVHFRVKGHTLLKRMMQSYRDKMCPDGSALRFMFDGHLVTDTDTPKKLDLKNGDIIEVYQIRTGGSM